MTNKRSSLVGKKEVVYPTDPFITHIGLEWFQVSFAGAQTHPQVHPQTTDPSLETFSVIGHCVVLIDYRIGKN